MKFRHFFHLIESSASTRIYEADGVRMRLDFLEGMLRVALLKKDIPLLPTWSVCPGESDCPLEGRDKLSLAGLKTETPSVRESETELCFTLSGVDFTVELLNFRISAHSKNGLLYQDRNGLAYNFDKELGSGSVHYTRRLPDQKIFGLGDKCGHVNKDLCVFDLGAGDSMGFLASRSDPLYKQIPFYICETDAGSYGLYYDTYSNGRVNFGVEHDNYFEPFNSIRFEEENLVFYLILGSNLEIVQRFSRLTGPVAPVPDWAFRYCGSTMEYTDAPDTDEKLRGFVAKCEENGIRAGGFYLSSGYTQIGEKRCVFHWNTEKIPSPEDLSAFFRSHGMEFLPNVKPAFLTDHPMYQMIAEKGWFLHYADGSPAQFPFWGGMASYLDFTNPAAYAFWVDCVKTHLVSRGYRNIWNDNNEYDVWDPEVYAFFFGKEIPAARIRPLFSYLMARASREASLAVFPDMVPFNVSRCAIAGTPRVASTWTGDNLTDFADLRFNHYQAMTMSLSGFFFFGPDIGGFAGPSPDPELFLRWIQYGIFLPRFVLHSWKPGEVATMPWLYPEKMDTVRRLFRLRESLVPYLSAQMQRCTKVHEPLIYPVFLKEPGYDTESDAFFCGTDLFVCPVFDRDAESVTVQLPKTSAFWALHGTDQIYPGGSSVCLPCTVDDNPVWFVKVPY